MTSSSGSALPFRMTSNSPVEKPVTERSKSRSKDPNSASSIFRTSRSQPAPSAILLSAIRNARFCVSLSPVYVNRWDLGEPHGLGGHEAPMAGNNASVGISQDRVYKAELSDRCDDLIDLLFGMRPRIARIRSKRAYGAIGHRKRGHRIGGSSHLAHPVWDKYRTNLWRCARVQVQLTRRRTRTAVLGRVDGFSQI